jgi:hypothetical protein
MLLSLKLCNDMYVFLIKSRSDAGCFRSKFKIIRDSIVICAHLNKKYICAYRPTVVFCHFRISIITDNTNCLLVLKKIVPGGISWLLSQTENHFWPEERKELDHSGLKVPHRCEQRWQIMAISCQGSPASLPDASAGY